MPTEMTRSPKPFAGRAGMRGMNSPDVTPPSPAALAIIAVLVLILHVASQDIFDRSLAHSPGGEVTCPANPVPAELSLPFD